MKLTQTYGCLLLFGALLNWGSCGQKVKMQSIGGPGYQYDIQITNCRVPPTEDGTSLKPGTTVVWHSEDKPYRSYTITFERKFDGGREITPSPNQIPFSSSQKTATWNTATNTPTDCSDMGCYFKYSISYTGTASFCNDPGIRIEQ